MRYFFPESLRSDEEVLFDTIDDPFIRQGNAQWTFGAK